ncbi:hypothetical protein LCGC14_1909210 [marine sediment metagenome]|uniref:Uncharacterized protein n=1 Tax=marine sediment metagenome TaxID=412755 RepID=A0A0F9I848_9ZZZZ
MPTADQLNDLRRKILADEDVSQDELRSAIETLTGERIAAHAAANKKATKTPSVKVDLDDLLG